MHFKQQKYTYIYDSYIILIVTEKCIQTYVDPTEVYKPAVELRILDMHIMYIQRIIKESEYL